MHELRAWIACFALSVLGVLGCEMHRGVEGAQPQPELGPPASVQAGMFADLPILDASGRDADPREGARDASVEVTPGDLGERDAAALDGGADAATLVDAEAEAVITGPLAEQLFGHWQGSTSVGNCLSVESWYSFSADGRVVGRVIDDNSCSGPRLIDSRAGHYVLHDRLLTVFDAGPGIDWPSGASPTDAVIAMREERFTIALGERPADAWRPATLLMDQNAFASSDGRTFRSEHYVRLETAGGNPHFEKLVVVTAELDAPLPLSEGAACHVALTFSASLLDLEVSSEVVTDEVAIEYDAVVYPSSGWKQILADELAAVPREEQGAAWQAMQAARGITEQSHPLFWRFGYPAYPSLSFRDDDPNVLSVELPIHGSLIKAPELPLLP